jgi:hypothetical protein
MDKTEFCGVLSQLPGTVLVEIAMRDHAPHCRGWHFVVAEGLNTQVNRPWDCNCGVIDFGELEHLARENKT